MTNEEKVKEIIEPFAFFNDNYQVMIAWGADQMARWKDQQLKEYLEKKIITINSTDYDSCWELLNEIINELFNKE